jgi:hypothetical protein
MFREISKSIEIEAGPARVWAELTDTASFPSWNPFITRLEGELREGARLKVRIEPPGGRPSTFRPTLLAVEPERELRWLGRVVIPGLFDGEHSLRLERIDRGWTRFTQAERFSGLLVAPLGRVIDRAEAGFQQMNRELKTRSER